MQYVFIAVESFYVIRDHPVYSAFRHIMQYASDQTGIFILTADIIDRSARHDLIRDIEPCILLIEARQDPVDALIHFRIVF